MTVAPVVARAAAGKASKGQVMQRVKDGAAGYSLGKARSGSAKGSGGSGGSGTTPSGITLGGNARRLLIAEFTLCMVVLAFSPVTDTAKTEKPGTFMKRASAVMGVFFILGLISTAGRGASKAAAGFGGLMTVTLLISSRSIFTVLTAKLGKGIGEAPSLDEAGEGIADAIADVGNELTDNDSDDDYGQGVPNSGSRPTTGGVTPLFPVGVGGAGFR